MNNDIFIAREAPTLFHQPDLMQKVSVASWVKFKICAKTEANRAAVASAIPNPFNCLFEHACLEQQSICGCEHGNTFIPLFLLNPISGLLAVGEEFEQRSKYDQAWGCTEVNILQQKLALF